MKKVLICSIGRTGSHILYNYFLKHGYKGIHVSRENQFTNPEIDVENYKTAENLVLHHHGCTFMVPDFENWTVIVNTRKNLFDQYCSFVIAHRTGQWLTYDSVKKFPRISINMNDALTQSYRFYRHPDQIKRILLNNRPWNSILEITYEEFADNQTKLFEIFPLESNYNSAIQEFTQSSPYRFENCIYRYKETAEEFNERFKRIYKIQL